MVNYTVTYTGDDADGQMAAFVSVDYVTGSGTTVNSLDKLVVAPDPAIDTMSALYNGGATTGLRKVVDIDDPGTGTVRLRRDVEKADEMALDTASTKTTRVKK